MKESELYAPLKNWLITNSEYEIRNVYGEVGLVDVVAINELHNLKKESISCELKLHLNFKVIEQAIRDLKFSDYVYIVVPKPKKAHSFVAIDVLKNYGIGLIYIKENIKSISVIEKLKPKKQVNLRYNIKNKVKEVQKDFIGGVKSGDGDTEYKITIRAIKAYMETKREVNDGWVTAKEITENVKTHFKSPTASVYKTLQEYWNSDWCETTKIKNKRYFRKKL